MDSNESLRIRSEAQAVCQLFRMQVVNVDSLPAPAGKGFAVTIWIPRNLTLDGPEVKTVRDGIEGIKGVTQVWIQLAPDAG